MENNLKIKQMTIKAKFIGTNSLGYENGKTYTLRLNDKLGTSISRLDNSGYCPYQSLSAFLKNWTDISNQ